MSARCCAWHISDTDCWQDMRVCCSKCPSPDGDAYRIRNRMVTS